jgi:hypothetical protein
VSLYSVWCGKIPVVVGCRSYYHPLSPNTTTIWDSIIKFVLKLALEIPSLEPYLSGFIL